MAEPDQRPIYAGEAERYDRLVAAEDWQGNLLPAIGGIAPLADAEIVEFGAGTGRLTRLMAPHAAALRAFDRSRHMLQVARRHLSRTSHSNWTLTVADNRAIPLRNGAADLAIAGWTFGHNTVWNETGWRADVAAAVGEMLRLLRPGGTAIILETLGTGRETPHPPTTGLANFYRWLEAERGFARHWLRTDFRFASHEQARELLGLFFGAEMVAQVRPGEPALLPECTGIWWRRR